MTVVHALDDYYLAITLLITVAYQLFFFSIAFSFKFDKLTDFAGGTNFVVLAIITLAFSGHHNARQIVASLFIMVWGARLSAFLLFRILKTGKDDRFDDKRDKFFPFLGFWVFQMLWVWIVSLPVTLINSPKVTRFPQPNFGTASDIAEGYVHGGARSALYASVVGAIFLTTLLMFVSGLTLQERPGAKKRYEKNNHWEEYSRYLNRTSILIPFPPQLYEKMPTILKRTIFLEFPIYVFDPAKHSDQSPGQRSAEEGRQSQGEVRPSTDNLVNKMNASCQCGAVTFTTPLPKPLAIYICHCDTSSAFACSAIFPRFELPCKESLCLYSRPTVSGDLVNCYFCKTCGTRIIHSTPGKNVVSVRGGCLEGLDWSKARHIWVKRAMVPIPEGVETSDEEPENCSFDTGLVRTAEGLQNGEDIGGSGRPFPMS
ncbi:3-oxo-5-alpha-steroid 4-dehydrogenase protein [Rutstroemia sp. NJR-2017a BBW]|nr:3-oxo-5-alpha-steroid 4-dehydrogenase protein [Rutstroemia sp. NJR-2017a BBW]